MDKGKYFRLILVVLWVVSISLLSAGIAVGYVHSTGISLTILEYLGIEAIEAALYGVAGITIIFLAILIAIVREG